MRISWHKQTRDDFAAIRLFHAETNPAYAEEVIAAVFQATRRLKRFPELGHEGRVPPTYELLVTGTKIIIAYIIDREGIIVLTVRSGDRRWPRTWLRATVKSSRVRQEQFDRELLISQAKLEAIEELRDTWQRQQEEDSEENEDGTTDLPKAA